MDEKRADIFDEIHSERERQDRKWGLQNHRIRDDSLADTYELESRCARMVCDRKASDGTITWFDILHEEFFEVFAESDPARQREELIQMVAVGVAMIECIDREKP